SGAGDYYYNHRAPVGGNYSDQQPDGCIGTGENRGVGTACLGMYAFETTGTFYGEIDASTSAGMGRCEYRMSAGCESGEKMAEEIPVTGKTGAGCSGSRAGS